MGIIESLRGEEGVTDAKFARHPILLHFFDESVEARFLTFSYKSSLIPVRFFIVSGMSLFLLAGLLDYLVLNEQFREIFIFRLSVVIPVLIIAFLLSYTNFIKNNIEPFSSTCLIFCALSIVYMIDMIENEISYKYYAGLILLCTFLGSVFILRFRYNIFVLVSVCMIYYIYSYSTIPITQNIINIFFLFNAAIISAFSGWLHELRSRHVYVRYKMFEHERNRAIELMQEAQSANATKNDFLANMSHELRTPLNAICGFSEVMMMECLGEHSVNKYKEYSSDIYSSGKHLLSIIDEILDLAKAESGKFEVAETDFYLDSLVDSCVKMTNPLADSNEVCFVSEVNIENCIVRADERLMRQALLNMLSNAIKFTPKGNSVLLRIEHTDKGLVFSVVDEGIGIKPENIERIKLPFEQVGNAFVRSKGGTGLGIPLTEKILKLHGSTLNIQSTFGSGTNASFVLGKDRFCCHEKNNAPEFDQPVAITA